MAPTPDPDEPMAAEAASRPHGEAHEEGGDPACWAHLFDEGDGDEAADPPRGGGA